MILKGKRRKPSQHDAWLGAASVSHTGRAVSLSMPDVWNRWSLTCWAEDARGRRWEPQTATVRTGRLW